MNIFVAPFINAIFGLYYLLGNLGWAVVVVTILIRMLLLPLLWPSLKSQKKMMALQPRLKKLQEKYKDDKQGLAKAQMDMYKTEGVNPLSGCLPNILQLVVLIVFFSAFNKVTYFAEGKVKMEEINRELIPSYQIKDDFKFNDVFLGTSLTTTPNKIFSGGDYVALIIPMLILIGSAGLQYFSSKLMMPSKSKVDQSAYTKATADKGDDMMEAMRTQSLYMMPAMTVFIGWNFSMGIIVYWFMNSLVMLGQQLLAQRAGKDK